MKNNNNRALHAAMWAGLYKDLAEQAWMDGKQYSQEVWHEYCKQQFLPEDDNPELPFLVTRHETWGCCFRRSLGCRKR